MQSIKLHTLEVMLKIYDLNSPLQAKVLVPWEELIPTYMHLVKN
jgi:hypothetical protein